jgi:hypothetical protein
MSLSAILMLAPLGAAGAQNRVGSDSATRLTHFGRSIAWGTVEGLAFSGIDQLSSSPPQWGRGWPGYEKRAASNLGEFYIQESVSEGLAALMNRPVDYRRCRCGNTMERVWWAVRGAVTDQMPDGTHPIAVPRIVGAYVGSFAQAAWRPGGSADRTRVALVNSTVSLAFGAAINLFYEFRPRRHDR